MTSKDKANDRKTKRIAYPVLRIFCLLVLAFLFLWGLALLLVHPIPENVRRMNIAGNKLRSLDERLNENAGSNTSYRAEGLSFHRSDDAGYHFRWLVERWDEVAAREWERSVCARLKIASLSDEHREYHIRYDGPGGKRCAELIAGWIEEEGLSATIEAAALPEDRAWYIRWAPDPPKLD